MWIHADPDPKHWLYENSYFLPGWLLSSLSSRACTWTAASWASRDAGCDPRKKTWKVIMNEETSKNCSYSELTNFLTLDQLEISKHCCSHLQLEYCVASRICWQHALAYWFSVPLTCRSWSRAERAIASRLGSSRTGSGTFLSVPAKNPRNFYKIIMCGFL